MTGITNAMARTKKPPRKRRSDFEGRTRIVTLKFTEEEHLAIERAVDALNKTRRDDAEGPATVSSWIRDHAIAQLKLR